MTEGRSRVGSFGTTQNVTNTLSVAVPASIGYRANEPRGSAFLVGRISDVGPFARRSACRRPGKTGGIRCAIRGIKVEAIMNHRCANSVVSTEGFTPK